MKRKREDIPPPPPPDATPSRRSRVRDLTADPSTPSKANGTPRKAVSFLNNELTESELGRSPRTPRQKQVDVNDDAVRDPPIVRNANRSARRKSVRNMIQRSIREDLMDEEDGFDEEDNLAQRIFDDEDAGSSESESDDEKNAAGASTPAKKPRGRQRKKKEKSPPPVVTIEGPTAYFEQNRGRARPSSTTTTLPPLSPKTYFRLLEQHENKHAADVEHLSSLHKANFDQWVFELSQGFNILLYGYGSKRKLLMEFIKKEAALGNHVVVINGYVGGLTIRDIVNMVVNAVLGMNHGVKFGVNVNEMMDSVLQILDEHRENDEDRSVTLLVHSIDAAALRTPQMQALLAQLSSHPAIRLIASSDNILSSLLWDSSTLTLFNFVFHDATTFVPYDLEISAADESEGIVDVITGGTAGRSGRSGAKGVKYVLASLTGNAKNLYRILIATQLAAMEDDGAGKDKMGTEAYGIAYRTLYQKGLEEFVCSSDLVFKTLLKEFYDHQMVTSRKDLQGSEVLWAPFRKEELESILEDIMLS
ncbi:Origin recognition complex subunit 2 [Arthrobotrys musiformis]|uniref:Origin recognition complex subunit 2 n=1 Tax=Arthrobotrys musiformis TaxID=47236 RepID=A0AAV9WDA5_9PEZI